MASLGEARMPQRVVTTSPLIVLIENDAANRMLAEMILSRAGYRLHSAADGQTALALLEGEVPALILTDLSMPLLDGYGLARALRARPRYAQVPLVAITAHAHAEERQRALSMGFADVLVKPYRREQLLALVERRLAGAAHP